MGMISWLTGSQAANRNVSRSSANGLRDALLALNSPSRPWLVRPGLPGEADLVAMWNVDSPDWHDKLFGAMLDLNLKILLRLDESSYTVRSIDKSVVVGSDPQRRGQISWGKGQIDEESYELSFGKRSDGTVGKLSANSFRVSDIKSALKGVVLSHGWSWRRLLIGGL